MRHSAFNLHSEKIFIQTHYKKEILNNMNEKKFWDVFTWENRNTKDKTTQTL